MSYIDGTGTVVWEIDTAIVDPILKVDGNYILIAEKGRNKICLYIDNKLQYDVDDPDTVMSAELSSNGDVVVVTDNRHTEAVYLYIINQANKYSHGRREVTRLYVPIFRRRREVSQWHF